MKYRIKKSFGGYFNFSIGDVREFTVAEALRYQHLIEPVQSETVNAPVEKPNKQYKKGRIKG